MKLHLPPAQLVQLADTAGLKQQLAACVNLASSVYLGSGIVHLAVLDSLLPQQAFLHVSSVQLGRLAAATQQQAVVQVAPSGLGALRVQHVAPLVDLASSWTRTKHAAHALQGLTAFRVRHHASHAHQARAVMQAPESVCNALRVASSQTQLVLAKTVKVGVSVV